MKKVLVVASVKNPRLRRAIDLSIILSVYAATIKLIISNLLLYCHLISFIHTKLIMIFPAIKVDHKTLIMQYYRITFYNKIINYIIMIILFKLYRIAGKFGGLAVMSQSPEFPIPIYTYGDPVPNHQI